MGREADSFPEMCFPRYYRCKILVVGARASTYSTAHLDYLDVQMFNYDLSWDYLKARLQIPFFGSAFFVFPTVHDPLCYHAWPIMSMLNM